VRFPIFKAGLRLYSVQGSVSPGRDTNYLYKLCMQKKDKKLKKFKNLKKKGGVGVGIDYTHL
jgi:hypothetical protein